MRKQTQIYVADFETTTSAISSDSSKVWLSYIENINDENDSSLGFSIEDFFNFIESKNYNQKIYFHNLNFDCQFLLHFLGKNYNYSKANVGQYNPKLYRNSFTMMCDGISSIYKIKLRTIKDKTIDFLCSYKILMSSVASLSGMEEKILIDYDKVYTKDNIPDEVIKYIKNDVKVVIPFIKTFYKDYKKEVGITSSGTAMKIFRNRLSKELYTEYFVDKIKPGKFKNNGVFEPGEWDYYKNFYLGGWTWIKESIIQKQCLNISVYDVNSLYPYIMRNFSLPVGEKIDCEEKDCEHFKLIECILTFKIKDGGIPFIPNNQGFGEHIIYLDEGNKIHCFFTQEMLECVYRHYNVSQFLILNESHFERKKYLFRDYIDHFQEIKQNSKKGSFEYLFSKLMQNQLYGKFGMSYKRKKYYLREIKKGEDVGEKIVYGRFIFDYEWDLSSPSYIPMAIAITSFAKIITIDFANYANRLCNCVEPTGANLYNDTDSCHLSICKKHKKELEENQKIDSKKLGYWDNESNLNYGYYIKRKLYFEFNDIDDYFSKNNSSGTAGISKNSLDKFTYRDIIENKWIPTARTSKKVNGGVILIDKEKNINGYRWNKR